MWYGRSGRWIAPFVWFRKYSPYNAIVTDVESDYYTKDFRHGVTTVTRRLHEDQRR